MIFDDVLRVMAHNAGFFYGFVFVFSLIVGSFLNVVIHRLPRMMEKEWECDCREHLADELKQPPKADQPKETYNLVLPRSACPKCGHQITALENIPIISWLVLKGKCSSCKTKISARYPMVELLTAILSVAVAIHFGYGAQAFVYIVLTWGLIALTFIDLDKMLLPDQITFPLVWIAMLSSVYGIGLAPKDAVIGAIVGYLSLWLVYWVFYYFTGKKGFGFGDFNLLMVFGAFLGWQNVVLIIFLSSIVGAIIGGIMYFKNNRESVPIPYGPYIAIAGWIALLWGNDIIHYYLSRHVYTAY